MTEPLQVGQFAIVDHEPVDRGPNAGIFHGKGPADDRAELFVVAEGTTPASEAFAGHVVSAAGQAWGGFDMSLTGSLRRLFEEAERSLRDWNVRSIAQHRVSLGMSCLARRGEQVILAQAGPSVIFHLAQGRVEAYFPDEEHAQPLGTGRVALEPQLTRIDLQPGERVLLVSSMALNQADEEIISGILALPPEQVLPNLYRRLREARNLTVVLVSAPADAPLGDGVDAEEAEEFVIGAPSMVLLEAPAGHGEDAAGESAFQPSLFVDNEDAAGAARRQLLEVLPRVQRATIEAVAPVMATEAPLPLRRVAGDDTLTRLAAQHSASAATGRAAAMSLSIAAAAPARAGWHGAAITSAEASTGDGRHRRRQGSFSRGLVREETPPRPDHAVHHVPLVDDLAREQRSRTAIAAATGSALGAEEAAGLAAAGSLVRVRSTMQGRWRSNGGIGGRSRTAQATHHIPTWAVVLAGLAVLLAVVGFVVVPARLREDSASRYAQLIDGAQKQIATARVQQDPAEKRKALTEAQGLLLEAREAPGAGAEAKDLIDEVAGAISQMDAVRTPASVEAVGSLEQFGDKPVAISRIAMNGQQAFLLDNASGQVISMVFPTGERKVVYGENKEAKQGRPVAVVVFETPDGSPPMLVIADMARTLWTVNGGQVRPLAFSAPQNLVITDMVAAGRELYVLDAPQATIYRYQFSDGGFGTAAGKLLSSPDLAHAARLMIDNEIITADADGTLHRFSGQLSLRLSEAGIDHKLVEGQSPQALAPGGEFAILDAPNDRIVVLKRDGTFDRQYRHKEFRGATAFVITRGAAYVFSSGQLRRISW